MSVLLDKNTKVMVQGITGKAGSLQTKYMLEYGTNIVAGVTPGKGGQVVEGVPVYDSPEEAVAAFTTGMLLPQEGGFCGCRGHQH